MSSELVSKKRAREDDDEKEAEEHGKRSAQSKSDSTSSDESSTLSPPFFHYVDHSTEQDNDPFTPLAPMARVPTFPAKMYGESFLRHNLDYFLCC